MTDWTGILTIGFAVLTAFVGSLWWLWSSIQSAKDSAKTANDHVQKELTDFKLQVSQQYVPMQALIKFEERIGSAIDRLADRIDRFLEKDR